VLQQAHHLIAGETLFDLELGHSGAQVSERDAHMSDTDILLWAVAEDRIVVTTDQDFEEMIWRKD
jgi:predicted nuclease of predicted toxin-antitoxin system